MRCVTLGTRGEVPMDVARHRNHSGVLVGGKLLFDCGEEKYLTQKLKAIFITHLHPDHATFVRKSSLIPKVPTYAPEKGGFPFITVSKSVEIDHYLVRPIPTRHSSKVKSCAYLIEHGSKRILYTGDLVWIDKKYRSKLGKLDCVITEASYLREGGLVRKDTHGRLYGHQGVPNIVRMFKPHTNKIVLTHFGSWFFKDIAKSRAAIAALGAKYDVDLIAAHDGMFLEI